MTSSGLTIKNNRIMGSRHTPAEPMHADAIQGWTMGGATNHDVIIDGNIIINGNISDQNYMMGIDIFDGKWQRVTVSNNVVVTNTWNGIALYGVDQALVVNNTVLAARPSGYSTWISIHPAKDKRQSNGDIVRNNVATAFNIDAHDVELDHNIAEKSFTLARGDAKFILDHGAIGLRNVVNPSVMRGFVAFDPEGRKFDLRLRPNSPAAGAGSADRAPAVDAAGKPRKPPVSVGAYEP